MMHTCSQQDKIKKPTVSIVWAFSVIHFLGGSNIQIFNPKVLSLHRSCVLLIRFFEAIDNIFDNSFVCISLTAGCITAYIVIIIFTC